MSEPTITRARLIYAYFAGAFAGLVLGLAIASEVWR